MSAVENNRSNLLLTIASIALAMLFIIGLVLDYLNIPSRFNVNTVAWSSLCGSALAIMGTYFVTKKSMEIQMKNQKEIWEEEKKSNIENTFRMLNAQHWNEFNKSIKRVLFSLEYLHTLRTIEKVLDEEQLFRKYFLKASECFKMFFLKVSKTHFYDCELVKFCDKISELDFESIDCQELEKMYKELSLIFLGDNSLGINENQMGVAKEKAFIELYQKCRDEFPRLGLSKKVIIYTRNISGPEYNNIRSETSSLFSVFNHLRNYAYKNKVAKKNYICLFNDMVEVLSNSNNKYVEDPVRDIIGSKSYSEDISKVFICTLKCVLEEVKDDLGDVYTLAEDILNEVNINEELDYGEDEFLEIIRNRFFSRKPKSY